LPSASADRLVPELDLGNQDHLPSAGQARLQRDPAGIASHHLDHHHPMRSRQEAGDSDVVAVHRRLDDRAQGRVHGWAVAARRYHPMCR